MLEKHKLSPLQYETLFQETNVLKFEHLKKFYKLWYDFLDNSNRLYSKDYRKYDLDNALLNC